MLWTILEGKTTRVSLYQEKEEAIEAAGLPKEPKRTM